MPSPGHEGQRGLDVVLAGTMGDVVGGCWCVCTCDVDEAEGCDYEGHEEG